jgi:hypothetical protein
MCVLVPFRYLVPAKLFKAQWEIYVPSYLTVSKCTFCIYGSCLILTINVNKDYFLQQH